MAASFYLVTSGTTAQAQDVNQILYALRGDAGLGIPLSPTAVNDSVNFALTVKNLDSSNSRALQVIRANGTVLLQADVNGVVSSVDGTSAPSQLVNLATTQTLSNKTLATPSVSGGIVLKAGTAPVTTGSDLGIAGTAGVIGNGASNNVTVPLKGTGSGPTFPQVVNAFLTWNLGGTTIYVPYFV